MMRRYLIPLVFGIGGFAVLVWLGVWQLQRMAWKEGMLTEIDARVAAAPVAVPAMPDPVADRYLPVTAKGRFIGTPVRVLVSTRQWGAGYRLVTPFELADGRRIMVDEGFVGIDENTVPDAADGVTVTVTGNLHWPDEIDRWTPKPDFSAGQFYARDVKQLAGALETEPVLIVARTVTGVDARATPLPVTSEGIPNNHLGYAVQWFGLAIVWLGMTLFLLWRIRQRTA